MSKRAPANRQRGLIGESATKLAFERLGWGPIEVGSHDTGTDLFVQVRDDELTELGLLLGVQVKSEAKYFTDAARTKALGAESPGWSYRAKSADARYWLDHSVPHLVVVYDDMRDELWWGHVNPTSVTFTEVGAKVWIPAQRLDEGSRGNLLRIASDARSSVSWDGTVWDDPDRIEVESRLRFAMLTPRILAPHPNKVVSTVSAPEGIAMLLLGQIDELQHHESRGFIPKPEQRESGPVSWRIFEGFYEFMTTGGTAQMDLLRSSPDLSSSERVAIHVALSTFLAESGDNIAALSVLQQLDLESIVDTVDRAWALLCEVRFRLELGEDEDVPDDALRVAAVGQVHGSDPTAATLTAGALNTLFLLNPWDAKGLENLIRANDAAPRWWAAQQRSWALGEFLDEEYENRVGGKVKRAPWRETWQKLRGLVLTAGLGGDQRAWRGAALDLARLEFMSATTSTAESFRVVLTDMKLAGNKKTLEMAIKRLLDAGPVSAVRDLASALDLSDSSTTTRAVDLRIVQLSSDVMDGLDASRHLEWCTEEFAGWGQNSAVRESPRRQPITEVLQAIERLLPRTGTTERLNIRTIALGLPAIPDQSIAKQIASLVEALPQEEWSLSELETIASRAGGPLSDGAEHSQFGDQWELVDRWHGLLAARGIGATREQLHEQAVGGSARALASVGTLSEFSSDQLASLAVSLRRQIAERREEASLGRVTIGNIDPTVLLVRLNLFSPGIADWGPVEDALRTPSSEWDLEHVLSELGDASAHIPESVADVLGPLAFERAGDQKSLRANFLGLDIAGKAQRAGYLLKNPLTDNEDLVERLHGGTSARASVCVWIGRRGASTHGPLLAALSGDSSADVRVAAAAASVAWILRGEAPPIAQETLRVLVTDSGVRVAYGMMRAIPHRDDLSAIEPVLEALQEHPSAAVRQRAGHLLEDPLTCNCS